MSYCVSQWSFSSAHSTGDAFGYHRHREFFTKTMITNMAVRIGTRGVGGMDIVLTQISTEGICEAPTHHTWLAVQYSLKYADMKLRP